MIRIMPRIIQGFWKPLTFENWKDCFIIDETLYERVGYIRTELATCVFDSVSVRDKKEFCLMHHLFREQLLQNWGIPHGDLIDL